jgi:tyrosyl-tRNA synthetase
MGKIIMNQNIIKEALERGVERIYPNAKALEELLKSGRIIRLYCGYDPTAPDLHIGHAITLRKLAQFQKLGHEVIFLIGDFTGLIGDPSDKTAARRRLTREQLNKNLKNYKEQAGKILSFSGENPAKIMFNGKWNDKLSFIELIELASNFTVQQMITRDMFQERIKKNKPIYLHEFLYPLAQAYDSVAMDVDLEVGGNDQTFNMLCGRDLMRVLKNKEKIVLTTKLLNDPSGKKMGKTEGNIVNLNEPPNEMYGKIMSWPDSLILPAFELCTDLSMEEVEAIKNQIKNKKTNPRDVKARLAKKIIGIHHNKTAALKAEKEFNRIFKERRTPSEVKGCKLDVKSSNILDLLFKTRLASSKSEAKRLIEQGAIRIDKLTVKDWRAEINIKKGIIIQAGKRKFIKLV